MKKKTAPEMLEARLARTLREPLESPPEWLMNWAEDLPRSHPRRVARGVRQALTLAFDSWALIPVGARSGADQKRRLVFRSGKVDLDLEVEALGAAAQRVLRGQVLDAGIPGGRTFATGEVRLLRGTKPVASTTLHPSGDFTFQAVASERYTLQIDAPGFRCRVAGLEL